MQSRRAIATNGLARLAALLTGVLCVVSPPTALAQGEVRGGGGLRADPGGVDVGRISDLDLDAVRAVIDQSDDVGALAPTERRALSLEEALETALENNLSLQIVALDVESSEREIDGSRAKFHPVAQASGSASGTKRDETDPLRQDQFTESQQAIAQLEQQVPTGGQVSLGVGYRRDFTDEAVTTVGTGGFVGNIRNTSEIAGLAIEIKQPLLKGGRIYVARKPILDAEYDNEIRRAELQGEILRVTAETKSAYYSVIGALRQIEVIEQAIERDAELVRASAALFDAGRVSKVDIFNAQISESNDRARLATSRADFEVAQNELRRVLGLPIQVQIDVTDTTLPFRPIRIELDEWIARAIDARPEMKRLQSRLDKVELAVRASKNAALPSLDVSGGFAPGFDWASYNYNAGVAFEYPLGNVAAESRLKQAQIEHARVRHEMARQRRDIELEVREVEIRLRESVSRLRSLTAAVAGAREKGEIARGRFELGLASNFDITNADEELIRAESLLLEALVDYATQIARLEASVGGEI